jgi:hypothetical protein
MVSLSAVSSDLVRQFRLAFSTRARAMSIHFGCRLLAVLIPAFCLAGCGGEMKVAPVSGTITLDGEPLEKASVLFQPEKGGRPSFGVTDKNGYYSLAYSMNESGAEVGGATVKISTRLAAADTGNGDYKDNAPRAPEKVPAHYGKQPVKVTVEPKSNTIDIALKSAP